MTARRCDTPFGSVGWKTAIEPELSVRTPTVTHWPSAERRCSFTEWPTNERAAMTCTEKRRPDSARIVTTGCTPTATVDDSAPFHIASYSVRILGCARYDHVPPLALTSVTIEWNEVSPNWRSSSVTVSPAAPFDTVPERVVPPP